MTRYQTILPLLIIGGSLAPLTAGDDAKAPIKVPESNNGNWCEWLQNDPGTIYKNDDNPYVQEFGVFGRFQFQYAYVDGEGARGTGTQDFNYDTEEIRRLRLGVRLKFLKYFDLKANANLEADLAPTGLESDHDVEYADIYAATLTFDAQKAFGIQSLDALDIGIGKYKIGNNGEQGESSRKIKTIERSAISNYAHPENSTGIMLSAEKGDWDFALGMFSGDEEREFSAMDGSNDVFYYLHIGKKFDKPVWFSKSRADLRVVVNGDDKANQGGSLSNPNPEGSGTFDQDWVVSLSTESKRGRFALLTDVIYGENGGSYFTSKGVRRRNPDREGSFWGVVILPSYELIEDKLELVFRYQYAHASEKEGFRIGSRYSRRAGSSYGFTGANDLSDGRGDSHHSAYLGLNYYLCKDNAKVMLGVEYDDLDSETQDVYEGYTAWAAFRMFF
ncbi:MAG: porin [Akkermansiaceae bacterium]